MRQRVSSTENWNQTIEPDRFLLIVITMIRERVVLFLSVVQRASATSNRLYQTVTIHTLFPMIPRHVEVFPVRLAFASAFTTAEADAKAGGNGTSPFAEPDLRLRLQRTTTLAQLFESSADCFIRMSFVG